MAFRFLRIATVVAAGVAASVTVPPTVIERLYSGNAYLAIQHLVTAGSNRVRFALFDIGLASVATAWLAFAWRDVRDARPRSRAVVPLLVRSVVWGAALYLAFLAMWGLNYRRVPLREKLPYAESAVTRDALVAATRTTIDRLNALHAVAHAAGWPPGDAIDPSLAAGFARAAGDLHLSRSVRLARPKASMLDWYFRRSGTDGMTDPYFLETLLSTTVLPFERPFVIAHEWSHLAGLGDEGEANFLGAEGRRRSTAARCFCIASWRQPCRGATGRRLRPRWRRDPARICARLPGATSTRSARSSQPPAGTSTIRICAPTASRPGRRATPKS
jgi:hypothetical protein